MKLVKLLLVGALSTSALFAHGLWVNTFESDSKKAKRVVVSLGFGYKSPIDDTLRNSMGIKSFDLMTPDNKKIKLQVPKDKLDAIYEGDTISVNEGNLALQKIALNEKSEKGIYSIGFERSSRTSTEYINKKGIKSKSNKPVKEIKDLKELVSQSVNTNYGKAYFANKEFSKVATMGHKLEIIPTNDFSKLSIGDTIELDVLFDGKPLKSGYVLAKSGKDQSINSFYGNIRDGKVKFYLNNDGQWLFNISHKVNEKNITYSYSTSSSLNIK